MLWLCLSFPQLPLEIFTRATAEQQRPVAIVQKNLILCHNAQATAHGIVAGISSATAQTLCASILLLERHPPREAAALHNLADWAYRFTPELALLAPDSLLLEIGASLKLFGGLASLLQQLRQELDERGHAHRSGIAPTPMGAHLLARALPREQACSAARQLSDFRDILATLSLDLLECTEQQRRRLRQLGLSRIGELLSLPRSALGKRFGQDFVATLLRLSGERPDPRSAYQPRDFFHATQHFLEPVHDTNMLLFPMRRMLHELKQFLDRRQSYSQQISWRLQDQNNRNHPLRVNCSLQHHDHAALFDLTRLGLQQLRLPQAVQSLALLCRHHTPVHQQSASLLTSSESGTPEAQRLLLDKLAIRLGDERIHAIRTADAHLPEQAWRAAPLSAPPGKSAALLTSNAERPFWLLQRPRALRQQGDDLIGNGRIRLLRGPERIDNAWWSQHGARDYFVAQYDNGALCWVFREHASQQWFLHGLFG